MGETRSPINERGRRLAGTLATASSGAFSRDQAAVILHLAPPLLYGAILLLLTLLAVAAYAAASHAVILVYCLTVGLHIVATVSARRLASDLRLPNKRARLLIAAAAAVLGAAWGCSTAVAILDGNEIVQVGALLVAVGLVGWCILLFAADALTAALLVAPVVLGAALPLAMLGTEFALAASTLVILLAVLMPMLATVPAMLFRRHLADRSELREHREIIRVLLKEFGTAPSDWVWHFDNKGLIDKVSERFASASQNERMDLVGRDFVAFLGELSSENDHTIRDIEKAIGEHSMFHDVSVKVDRDGEEFWWKLTGKPIYDDHGLYTGYVGMASDITAERLAERRINFLAHHDNLTGLFNRGKFTEHLKHAVSRLERYGSPFSILYLDLDQFKSVNDSRGHLVGDRLLMEVSHRIRGSLRETDLAGRLGGDEFAVLLTNDCDAQSAASLASRLVESLCKPYILEDEIISIGVSIGIAMAPVNGTRPDQIMRNADLALYRAKAEGRATFRFFESQMDSSIRERRMLELELREAIKKNEFVLHYQPLVSAENHQPNAFEALLRWNHPIRGIVPPAEFIPIAEHSGLIKQIGDWTIAAACEAASRWPAQIGVAVNLSAKHFQLSDIAGVVQEALSRSGLTPNRLELEITESLLILNPDDVIKKLREIKELGVSIAMDDFGTGYSSLSYLLKFPFDKIKIDKSFVTASSDDITARDILRTIVSLAKSLDIEITAEGVETQGQAEFLSELACNQLQGYYFARALSEVDLAGYLMNTLVDDIKGDTAKVSDRLTA